MLKRHASVSSDVGLVCHWMFVLTEAPSTVPLYFALFHLWLLSYGMSVAVWLIPITTWAKSSTYFISRAPKVTFCLLRLRDILFCCSWAIPNYLQLLNLYICRLFSVNLSLFEQAWRTSDTWSPAESTKPCWKNVVCESNLHRIEPELFDTKWLILEYF